MKRKIIPLIYLWITSCLSAIAQINGQVNINVNEPSFSKQDGYDIIRWNASRYKTKQVGAPELPVAVQTFVVPLNVKVTGVEVSVKSSSVIEGTFMPYPVQPPIPIGIEDEPGFVLPDSAIYNGSEVFPKERAEIIADYNEMGYHLVTVRLNPVEYNPVSRKIHVSSLDFTLRYEQCEDHSIQPEAQNIRRANSIKKVIRSMVVNPQDVDRFADTKVRLIGDLPIMPLSDGTQPQPIDVLSQQVPDYIIITSKTLRNEFQRLADWKTQKGVPTIIKEVESIREEYQGSDLAEKIHAYLQECYRKWGAGLFVLLGGDTNIVPARFYNVPEGDYAGDYPSDSYYTDLECDWNANKNHLFTEWKIDEMKQDGLCYIGRAPVENSDETSVFVNKILAYEKMNMSGINTDYLMNHVAASAYNYKSESTGKLNLAAHDSVDKYLSYYPQIRKWYLFDHYNCDCSLCIIKTKFNCGEELNYRNFLAAIQSGGNSRLDHFHVVYHMDHSSPRAMGTSSIDKHEGIYVQDVDKLNNGDYLQVVISGGCMPAKFDEDCIAEHFINNPNGGAVAFIGNPCFGISDEHYQYKHFIEGLYKNRISSIGCLLSLMIEESSMQFDPNKNSMLSLPDYYRLHLLGDPEMPVWSAVPQTLDVKVSPQKVVAGKNTITVQIANLPAGEEALVCLMKDTEAYTTVTISDTEVHSFSFTPKTTGEIKVTVTARNFFPVERTIPVTINTGNMLSVAKYKFSMGYLAAGTQDALHISLRNNGKVQTGGIGVKLSTSSPYVELLNDSVFSSPIREGETFGLSSFFYRVAENAPEIARNEWNAVCFYLEMKHDGVVDVDTFTVDLIRYKTRIDEISITETTDGDLIPEAGETIKLSFKSIDLGPMPRYTNTTIEPVDKNLATRNQNPGWSFDISEKYVTGTPLLFNVKLYVNNILQEDIIMDVAKLPTAVDLSKIHHEAEDRSISLYWDKMGNETGYNIYRSRTEDGVFTKLNTQPLTTRYYKDDNLYPQKTYYYKISTVTEGRMESELSPAVKISTIYPTMGMFPLSMDKAMDFSCEAHTVDFDYDGQKEIVAAGRDDTWTKGMLVVVRPDGTEPYDIDGNATSYSGYATLPSMTEAVPVVADLQGNGEPCIISMTRDSESSGNYISCYSSLDKDNDKLPDLLWQKELGDMFTYRGAVVTDIDGPDGKDEKEIIFRCENLNKPVMILDAHGNQKACTENLSSNFHGYPAVADLDGDGYKEIIYGDGNGNVHIWNHDGTPYQKLPLFSRPGEQFSTPTICDFDGDGEKEILITTCVSKTSYIYVIKQNGTCLGNFDSRAANPISIPYTNASASGIDHPLSVGDINGDGKLEVVALGHECVRGWTNTGNLIFDRMVPGLFPDKIWANNMLTPILADVDGDGSIDIVFHQDNCIYAINNKGEDIMGFPLYSKGDMVNSVCVSDIDNDGKNELTAVDRNGYINVWKTNGKSSAIEWGRSRFDTGFTGEYIPGYQDPWVITVNTEWDGETFTNDIIVRSGTFRIPSGKTLQLRENCRIYVLKGGTLEIDGGGILETGVYVKDGGNLVIKNNASVRLPEYGSLKTEKGATVDMPYGSIVPFQ